MGHKADKRTLFGSPQERVTNHCFRALKRMYGNFVNKDTFNLKVERKTKNTPNIWNNFTPAARNDKKMHSHVWLRFRPA
jgi:hypothetical protein